MAFSVLLIFSNQFLFYQVAGCWEGDLKNPKELSHYDGLILLGGFSTYQSKTERIRFSESGDRLFQAIELFKLGKVDRFIFTGGSGRLIVKEKKEGEFLKGYIELLGVPDNQLLVEWNSRNTHENALETFTMLKKEQVEGGQYLLVTSGFHMKRAIACFKKVGLNVEPYITDPLQSTIEPDFADAITPSAGVLGKWELLFREWIGYVVYKIKGYA